MQKQGKQSEIDTNSASPSSVEAKPPSGVLAGAIGKVNGLRVRAMQGASPTAWALAYADWGAHLALAPSKQLSLAGSAVTGSVKVAQYAAASTLGLDASPPVTNDRRFSAPSWQRWPFNVMSQSYLVTEQWLREASTNVPGVSKHHEDMVAFGFTKVSEATSPANFLTNPEVIDRTVKERGRNLLRGARHLAQDLKQRVAGGPIPPIEGFEVGKDVAITPGKVVHRTRLMELIQYAPETPTVHAEPVLIVPAWIMKYYILDLQPQDSLVKYLVGRGHTVFMISWKNPTAEDRELGMDDYLKLGVMAALDAIRQIVPGEKIHATGYCLGGTILAIAAAAMARDADDRLKSVTLFAAQVDFKDAGELTIFIDEHQLASLDESMRERGVLDASQMVGAFVALRAGDLQWGRGMRRYLLGEEDSLNDIMAWNADPTRMPYRMHSRYLRQLYLQNELADGKYQVGGRPISLSDLHVPFFVVGTEQDHVAPWRSVYKIHRLVRGDVTFVLTSGGHNAGIVSEPGHRGRRFRTKLTRATDTYTDPDAFIKTTAPADGSWWVTWEAWLAQQSRGDTAPPRIGAQGYDALCDAPGTYVMAR
ncbi:MAG: alpha/beta fold hydrolase [Polyangiales bacterium]